MLSAPCFKDLTQVKVIFKVFIFINYLDWGDRFVPSYCSPRLPKFILRALNGLQTTL